MDENNILPYVEPIFRFCLRRLENRYDAEDLAGEILCRILEGLRKYEISNLDAWVWKVAHNRYARFIDARNRSHTVLTADDAVFEDYGGFCTVEDEKSTDESFEEVFRCLHTLSAEYRDLFVDYYLGEMTVDALAEKYALPKTTVKWRLHEGRRKTKERIGDIPMERIYKRLNWNTTTCNGAMNPDKYLHSQLARAICLAAYEKPLTVEEISLSTDVPTLYIEDALPQLLYGEAVTKKGGKYAANFIIFRQKDRKTVRELSAEKVSAVADRLAALLEKQAENVRRMDFYGHDFGMERLGYLIVPYVLRRKIRALKKDRLNMENGPYPPRRDGGYGWFIVQETEDEREFLPDDATGCNTAGNDDGSAGQMQGHLYRYWIAGHFSGELEHDGGLRWLCAKDLPFQYTDGKIPKDSLPEENAAKLIQKGLIQKSDEAYRFCFPCFTEEQFAKFSDLFHINDEGFDELLAEWILSVRRNFEGFVPPRLGDQINQWVSCYLGAVTGSVIEELIKRGVLRAPDSEKPLIDGIFAVPGQYIKP